MVQAVIDLGEHQNRVVQVVKGKYGFKNKSQAINRIIEDFEERFIGRELRPEFVEELKKIDKEKGILIKNPKELREFFDKL